MKICHCGKCLICQYEEENVVKQMTPKDFINFWLKLIGQSTENKSMTDNKQESVEIDETLN